MHDLVKKMVSFAVPALAITFLSGASFYAGSKFASVTPNGKYLVADKNAVILATVFDRGSSDINALKAEIAEPIVKIMKRYTDQGYVIIDGAKDEQGRYMVSAIPPGTRDITHELEAAVKLKDERK